MSGDISLAQARGRLFMILSVAVGGLIMGAALTLVLALSNQAGISRFKQAAKLNCERSREISPYIIRDYEVRHIMPAAALLVVKRTIPKEC